MRTITAEVAVVGAGTGRVCAREQPLPRSPARESCYWRLDTVRMLRIRFAERITFQVSFPSLQAAGAAVSATMVSTVTPDLLDQTTTRIVEEFHLRGQDLDASATLISQVVDVDVRGQVDILRDVFLRNGNHGFRIAEDASPLAATPKRAPGLRCPWHGVTWMSSDEAVPPSRLANLFGVVESLQAEYRRGISVVARAGDGNIHAPVPANPNILDDVAVGSAITTRMAEKAESLGGTVTGEHSMGELKRDLVALQFDMLAFAVHDAIAKLWIFSAFSITGERFDELKQRSPALLLTDTERANYSSSQ